MNLRRAALVLMIAGILPISASAIAASTNQSTGRSGGGGGSNPLSSNRGNDMGDVNPNFYTNTQGCVRGSGGGFSLMCPGESSRQQRQVYYPPWG